MIKSLHRLLPRRYFYSTNGRRVHLCSVAEMRGSLSDHGTVQTEKSFTNGSKSPRLDPGKLRLYSMRFCPYAQRTRLLLEHKGIPYETINVDLKHKPDWFLERNPLGLVPVLEHDGKVVYESLVCNDYLEDVFPVNKSTPTDPFQRARDRMLTERLTKLIKQFNRFVFKNPPEENCQKLLEDQVDVFEDELSKRGKFYSGCSVGNLDFLLWPWFERLCVAEVIRGYKVTQHRFPRLSKWIQDMYEVPAVQKTAFDTESHLAFLISLKNRNPNYDYGLTTASKL